jgi:hypothetical protein
MNATDHQRPMLPIEGKPDPKPYKLNRVTKDGDFVSRVAEYATEEEAKKHRRRPDWHYKIEKR